MKKFVLFLICIFAFSTVYGISEFTCIFTLINPSATDVAFGLKSGTANIWNTSPLSVWSNPAKLGYHNGFAYGYSHDPWFENVFSDMYHQSSYISYGWNGIGILLPAPSAKSRWGTIMSFGELEWTDEFGNVIGTFESYDACSKFAFGINSLEFVSNFISNKNIRSLQCYGELSVGFNYDMTHSELIPEGTSFIPDSLSATADAHSSGIGLIGRISPLNEMNVLGGFCTLDITGGLYYLNHSKEKITYINDPDFLPWGTYSAFSGKISIKKDILLSKNAQSGSANFTDNLFSFYYSQDNAQYGEKSDNNPSIWSYGYEVTLLDIFSIRNGHYKDEVGEVEGDTHGIGLNLNYRDIIQLQFNHNKFEFAGTSELKWDILFRADFIALYNMFSL